MVHRHITEWKVLLTPVCLPSPPHTRVCVFVCLSILQPDCINRGLPTHILSSVQKLLWWRAAWILKGYNWVHSFPSPKRHHPQLQPALSSRGDSSAWLSSHLWRSTGGKILHRSWFQAKSRRTATQLVASVSGQSTGWTWASPCQKQAFQALTGPQTCLSISERNDPFLSPSAAVGFEETITEHPNQEFCHPHSQYFKLSLIQTFKGQKVSHLICRDLMLFHGLSWYSHW